VIAAQARAPTVGQRSKGVAAGELLVVAGEASGDRIAAEVLGALGASVRAWGVGGSAAAAAGMQLTTASSDLGAMGIGDVARKMPAVLVAVGRVSAHALRRRPSAALLVNFTELNALLGRWLRARGVPVVWCVAPQVWAWRRGRLRSVARAVDRLAVILPFEEALWRASGVAATFVGHPAVDPGHSPPGPSERSALRDALGLRRGRSVVVLPGSRDGEVLRLAEPLCAGAGRLCARGVVSSAVLVRAAGLGALARDHAAVCAARWGVQVVEADPQRGAAPLLPAFDVAMCASGTASLEAALAGAAPVVAYRLDRIGYRLARWLVTTPHVALPNVLLQRRAFPELLQDEVQPHRLATAAEALLEGTVAHGEMGRITDQLRQALIAASGKPFGANVAELVREVARS
jgi:lipid-A-disaccharide synthase